MKRHRLQTAQLFAKRRKHKKHAWSLQTVAFVVCLLIIFFIVVFWIFEKQHATPIGIITPSGYVIDIPSTENFENGRFEINTNKKEQHMIPIHSDSHTECIETSNNNSLCLTLFPRKITFHSFHKTGIMLSREMQQCILNFCRVTSQCNMNQLNGWYTNSYLDWPFFDRKSLNTNHGYKYNLMVNRNSYTTARSNNIHLYILYIRDPLSTIVSGYNYHASGVEPWSKWNLNPKTINKSINYMIRDASGRIASHKRNFNHRVVTQLADTYNIHEMDYFWDTIKSNCDDCSWISSMKIQFNKMIDDSKQRNINMNNTNENVNYNYGIDDLIWRLNLSEYVFKNGISIANWYLLDKNMIFWEFIGYCKSVFVNMVTFYHPIKNILSLTAEERQKKQKRDMFGLRPHYKVFRMESFFTAFNHTVDVFLHNDLNIVDTKQNIYNLRKNMKRYKDANDQTISQYILDQRKKLFDILHTLSVDDPRLTNKEHIHVSGKGTETQQAIQLKKRLLSIHPVICEMIKQLTLSLDYHWSFDDYC